MDIYTLLTAVLLVVLFGVAIFVGIGMYVSSRRGRAEMDAAAALKQAAKPEAVVAQPARTDFFDGVEASSNIILEASRERPRRGEGYGGTKEADQFDL